MEGNKSMDISWVDRVHKRFKETKRLLPKRQEKLYHSIGREWVSGRTVIDIGCSTGLGSNILSRNARFVWGVDINQEAVEYAALAYERDNLSFAIMDIEKPPTRELSKFEIVVASEILEHLENIPEGLNTIKRFFDKNTKGFITAPNFANKEVKVNEKKHGLHLHHWDAGQFYGLMTTHFQVVTLYSVGKLKEWAQEETVDGNSKDYLIVAKVEKVK